MIRDNVDELIEDLKKHENSREYFYSLREMDRDHESYRKMNPIERASRIIYLNKTCYNGLFRVNQAGEFNTPYGNYKKPNIVNEPVLRAVSEYSPCGYPVLPAWTLKSDANVEGIRLFTWISL